MRFRCPFCRVEIETDRRTGDEVRCACGGIVGVPRADGLPLPPEPWRASWWLLGTLGVMGMAAAFAAGLLVGMRL